jgi:hypothetical protein
MTEQTESGVDQEKSKASSRAETRRDLNALIAERLFGFLWYRSHDAGVTERWLGLPSLAGGPWDRADGSEPISAERMERSIGDGFTRNIQGGWQVVVEMRRRGYWVDIQSSGLDPELWKITIQKSYASKSEAATKKITEAGWSVAEPVCLAALRALELVVDPSRSTPKKDVLCPAFRPVKE